ncbi:MAG: hypothetical protein AAF702_51645 [Chloroflexota bacterium]
MMSQNTKKRQKKLQKKNAKRKQKQATISQRVAAMTTPSLSRAKDWPLEDAWITADWQKREQIIQILVARRGPRGHVAIGVVVVDTMCLGAKNAYGGVTDEFVYQERLDGMRKNQEMISTDINLIAKVVRDSIAYASELGFRPNKDLPQAMAVIGRADPDACSVEVPLGGPEGKPYFFAGPHDNVDRIMNILTKKLGPDGFNYTYPLNPGDDEVFLDDEDEFGAFDSDEHHTVVLGDEEYKASN